MDRTSRQSDLGSFQKILFAGHLAEKNYIGTTRCEIKGEDIPGISPPVALLSDEPEEHRRWDLYTLLRKSAQR
jgi:hypothetical protein